MPRLGRRGAFLLTLGPAWAGHGHGIAADPNYTTARGLAHVTRYVPLNMLGWAWVVCGALAVAAAVAGTRWQPVGFTAIALPAALWGAAYTVTWASGGYPSASGSAAAWAGLALSLVWVVGLQESPRPGEVWRWT